MKKIFYYILAMICVMISFESCCSDNDIDKIDISMLDGKEYHSDYLTLKYGGEEMKGGTVEIHSNDNKLKLILKNIVPGEHMFELDNVTIDEEGRFSGENIGKNGAKINYNGNVNSSNGKMTLDINADLSSEMQGGLTGEWPLSHEKKDDSTNSLFIMKWTALNQEIPNGKGTANLINLLCTSIIPEYLNSITLYPDGSMTTEYYNKIEMGEYSDLFSWIKQNIISDTVHPLERDWFVLSRNNIHWYVKDSNIYFIPNLTHLLENVCKNEKIAMDPCQIQELVSSLSSLDVQTAKAAFLIIGNIIGVDFSQVDGAVLQEIGKWLNEGIPFKYKMEEGKLMLYVDKEMVELYMPVFFAFIPKLQGMFDNKLGNYTYIVKMLMNINELADIKKFWETNTDEFEIQLTFKKE